MKCLLRNSCSHKYLCCNFCNDKKCSIRCNDKFHNCNYWYNININSKEDENINPRKEVNKVSK